MSNKNKRFVWRDGALRELKPRPRPESYDAPFIRGDSMPPAHDPVTGQLTDSWSAWKRSAKSRGYDIRHISEADCDIRTTLDNESDADYERDAAAAYYAARDNPNEYLTEYDRHICEQINERWRNKA